MPNRKSSAGYTLIELLVTSVMMVLLLVGSSTLFINTLNHKLSLIMKQEIKEEGEYILNQISFFIRNARNIIEPDLTVPTNCDGSIPFYILTIRNQDGGSSTFEAINDRIASNSANLSSVEYTPSIFEFMCNINPAGNPYITLSFDLKRTSLTGETVSQTFKRTTLMRNTIN
jgi:hypothetical protein